MERIGFPPIHSLHREDHVVDIVTADARPKNLIARILGVITSPRATYAAVAARPRALGALALVVLVSAASVGVFMSTQVGREALLDQQVRFLEGFGRQVSDAQYQQLEARLRFAPYFAAAGQLVTLPLVGVIIAGVALAVFNLMGGDGTFKQTFAIVAHSGAIIALQQLFVLPLDYVRESLSSPTNLGVFFPFLDENTFPARLLGAIDLFLIWWMISLAIGLGLLYKRRTGPIAATLLAIYAVLAIVIAAVKSALSGA
jgi:Yip1 domain